MKKHDVFRKALVGAAAALVCGASFAADWSDTSISYRGGSNFQEPFNGTPIHKDIINFSSVSGYAYGTNFFSIDLLNSDSKDPAASGSTNGAQETYVVYRHTLDLGKVTGKPMAWGPTRGLGVTAGFDWNTKNDAGYNSKKRMLVAGPTVFMDVPGFLNISLLALWESNAPYSTYTSTSTPRYEYDTHPMLTAAWGIPFTVGGVSLSFEGYFNAIAPKGKDEYGSQTVAEYNFDGQIMYDLGAGLGGKPKTFKVGVEYQWWKNKFGNDSEGSAGRGAFAQTPMIRAEYHF